MPTQTTHNDARVGAYFSIFPPRDAGRGAAIKMSGTTGTVLWSGGAVYDTGSFVFSLAVDPDFLDIAYDQLDRPQICWTEASGESFIYFYDGTIPGYRTLSIGANAFEPAICSDYILEGVNTVLVYLKNRIPTYRLQSDRYEIEYTLVSRKARGIKAFGYGKNTNTIQIIVGLWR